MFNRYILAIDPSGNFLEGKGTTGWVLLDTETKKVVKFGCISASMYKNTYAYWDAHITLIDSLAGYHPAIVLEDYRLYHNRATSQINSLMETPRLIGVISYECHKRGYWVSYQSAVAVKTRWSDDLLVKKGFLRKLGKEYGIGSFPVVDHIRDALRHSIHFATFRKENHYEQTTNSRSVTDKSGAHQN